MEATEEQIAEEMSPDEGVPDGIDPETGEIIEPDAESQAQEPEQAAPRSQKEIDALTARLKAEADRHEKRVREIMGEDFALLIPNPTDWTPGYLFGVPEMLPSPEQVAEFDAILGRGASADLLPAEDTQPCEKCNALGVVLTGSRAPGQETKPCSTCNGSGFIFQMAPAPQTNGYTPPLVQLPDLTAPVNTPVVPDAWGRPFGHPHYGRLPSEVI